MDLFQKLTEAEYRWYDNNNQQYVQAKETLNGLVEE